MSNGIMHTRKALDNELIIIRDDVLRLSALVTRAVEQAIDALSHLNKDLAQSVVNDDITLDRLHQSIEDRVMKTFALQQPMARDLRILIAGLLISNELERMGDHAEGIARATLRVSGSSPGATPAQLIRMKQGVLAMIRDVMDAYVGLDPGKARAAASLDDEIDAHYQELFSKTIAAMTRGAITVEQGTYLLWSGHALERIGDRATNIAERIVYALSGDVEDFNPKPGSEGS